MGYDIDALVDRAHDRRSSDIHIVCGKPVRIRVDGELQDLDDKVLTSEDCENIARSLAGDRYEKIKEIGELDFAGTYAGIRCRLNVFRQQRHASAVIRLLSDDIPLLEDLGLPEVMSQFATWPRGIVIITGETGSGKSTTLASLLDRINHTRRENIITLEDPIEYVYTPDLCSINQREIGTDTDSYETGLKAILREDPDIILIGEMRSLDTIETALTAAETGHLVFATLHTNSAPDAIDRIVDVFPGEKQQQIRLQLSMTLKAVVSQQLLRKKGGKGRVAACEVMIVNSAIKNLIREGKSPQIVNILTTSASEGNITMDNMLIKMVREGKIDSGTALEAANDQEAVRKGLGMGGSSPMGQGGFGFGGGSGRPQGGSSNQTPAGSPGIASRGFGFNKDGR